MTRLVLSLGLLLVLSACSSFGNKDKPLSKDNVVASTNETSSLIARKVQKVTGYIKKKKAKVARKKIPADIANPAPIATVNQKPTPAMAEEQKASTPVDQNDLWARLRQGFALPELQSDRVRHYERYFTRRSENFYTMLDRAEWFLPYILTEVEKRNFPTEIALLPAVESAFVTTAKSRSAASGLWQFIPSTGKLFKLEQNKWYDGRRDPVKSTQAALDFLAQLDERFGGNWFHSIAAYNAGGSTIEREINNRARRGKPTDFIHLDVRPETKDYVPKLIAFRNIFLNPEKYGLQLPKLDMSQQFATLDAGSQIDLNLFLSLSGVDRKTFKFLNSAYYKNVTPPNGPHILHVPTSHYELAKTRLAGLSVTDRLRWAQYVVKPGDTLEGIAERYEVSVAGIRQSNKLKSNTVRPGKALMLPASAVKNAIARTTGSSASVIAKTASTQAPTKVATAKPVPKVDNKLTHKVRSGDTLWAIAQRYGVKVAQISKWNQISQSRTLRLGQRLTIYTSS